MRDALLLVLIAATLIPLRAADPERVILDTDCAYFNDDGAALAMLLGRREVADVVGMTIVPGNLWPEPGAEA
ncbi:MAG TPA: hypothetical protein VKS01_04030, partial [Bryobacteraceae bacterium]|nr:hypothetical protein [Bryobacteraceae bacterium]